MWLDSITAGESLPNDVNTIIEIPAEGGAIKYEMDKDSGLLKVDRFMPTAMFYPCNYGFIPHTLADDGDPTDVLVYTPHPVVPGSLIRARPIGILKMTDEAGEDSKVLMVPINKVCMEFANIKDLNDVPKLLLERIAHFFAQYKALEPNKWVKITGWEGREAAEKEIMSGVENYRK